MNEPSLEAVAFDTLQTEPGVTCVLCWRPATFDQSVVALEKDANGRWHYMDPPPGLMLCDRHSFGGSRVDFSDVWFRVFGDRVHDERRPLFGAEVPYVQEATA